MIFTPFLSKSTRLIFETLPNLLNKLKLSSKTNILIAATDGCFGYFQTPMHFELMLLQTLSASSSLSLWKSNIEAQITKVTQDDATLAMVATGWSNFNEIKRAFASRLIEIETKYKQM